MSTPPPAPESASQPTRFRFPGPRTGYPKRVKQQGGCGCRGRTYRRSAIRPRRAAPPPACPACNDIKIGEPLLLALQSMRKRRIRCVRRPVEHTESKRRIRLAFSISMGAFDSRSTRQHSIGKSIAFNSSGAPSCFPQHQHGPVRAARPCRACSSSRCAVQATSCCSSTSSLNRASDNARSELIIKGAHRMTIGS
jgi:hypothetical protein